MRKGKNVIGQSVLSLADGLKIDTVKDLLISENNDAIVALLVDEGGLLSSSRVIPIENVNHFGRDAVVVATRDSVVPASADPEVKAILQRKDTLLGKKVVTELGQAMGSVSDMYFDERSGRIGGFEISGGLLGDMARGTSYLPVGDIERLGPDVVFVRPETGEAIEGQVGGVQGALQSAGGKIGDATSQAQTNLQSAVAESEPEKRLIGRRAGWDVADDNGNIVVANGERIREEHVEWARQNDRLGVLTSAVTSGEANDVRMRAGTALNQAGDNLGSMWDRFVGRIGEMRDEQGRQADAAQTAQRLALIQDAIGRPVQKAILDKSDSVILDFGDIVTHKSIQLAFDAGMLDTLLASVHRATVSFPNDQLRARQPAVATVEKSTGGAPLVDELERTVQDNERQREEQREQARQQAEADRQQREREREQRAQERERAAQERQQEAQQGQQEAAASGSKEPGSHGTIVTEPVPVAGSNSRESSTEPGASTRSYGEDR